MTSKSVLKKKLSRAHWLVLALGKILVGIGIGLGIASHFWYLQPYWYLAVLGGATLLLILFYELREVEQQHEHALEQELKDQ